MKINGQMNVHNVLKTYQKSAKVEKTAGKKGLETDKVEISSRAREMQVAMKALEALPEVRQDKVDAIAVEIEKGTYKPSASDIVEKLFG